jgi:hypothetical protein
MRANRADSKEAEPAFFFRAVGLNLCEQKAVTA